MNEEKIMTPADLLILVEKADRGDFIEYYRGSLCINQTEQKRFLGKTAFLLYEEGLVLLSQKRLGDNLSIYYAIRTSNPLWISRYATNKIKEMSR